MGCSFSTSGSSDSPSLLPSALTPPRRRPAPHSALDRYMLDEAGGLKALHRGRGIVHDDRLRRKALDAIVALAGEEGVLTGAVDDHDCNRDRDRDQQRPTTGLAPPRLAGAKVLGHMECPVKGTDGNAEWLLVLRREGVSGEGGGGDETREKEGLVGVDRRAQPILQR